MYERVLVPLDGSPLAEIVLAYLRALSTRFGVAATFVHVCRDSEFRMCEAYVKGVADSAGAQLKGSTGIASAVAEPGNVASRILEEATKQKSSLILMSSHGQTGAGRWLLGSVAHKVVNASHVPVLVVREELKTHPEAWPENVIVALDGSPLSESVLPHAAEMARVGARVTLLRVCEPPVVLADYPDASMPEDWGNHVKLAQQGAEKACAVYLDELGGIKLKGAGVETQVVLAEQAAQGIIEYANRDPRALIVMSTHGRSGLSRFPFGHVTDRVLLACKNPILLVRPKK